MIVPSITDLEAEIRADLENELGIASVFAKRFINGFAANQAARLKTYYLTAAQVQKNIFVDTADSELDGGTLERWGRIKVERNPFPATQGVYELTVTGAIGGVVANGVTFRNPLNNAVYIVETGVTLTATSGIIRVRSLDAGREFLLTTGQELQSTSPIVNVSSTAAVTTVVTEPQNEETIERYREVVQNAFVTEPQGGSAADYRMWASDAQGVRRIYPFVGSQAGIINIYVEASNDTGIPTQSVLDAVESVINFDPDTTKPLNERGRRPISAWVINYLPVVPLDVTVTIVGLNNTSTAIANTIQSSIEQFLFDIRPFVGGADDPNNVRDTLRMPDLTLVIDQAIAANNFFTSIQLTVDGNIVSSFRFTRSNIPNLTTLTINP